MPDFGLYGFVFIIILLHRSLLGGRTSKERHNKIRIKRMVLRLNNRVRACLFRYLYRRVFTMMQQRYVGCIVF